MFKRGAEAQNFTMVSISPEQGCYSELILGQREGDGERRRQGGE